MYTSKEDIQKISSLIHDIRDGKISRNKNYFTLAKSKEYSCFKRAKLLLSLMEDLEKTAEAGGDSKVKVNGERIVEVSLYNPNLKYNRTVMLSEAELKLVKKKVNIADL